MSSPALVVVDENEALLRAVERELEDRYARHYKILCLNSAAEGRAALERLADEGQDVALVLVGRELSSEQAGEFCEVSRPLHPHAKRGLLVSWGDWGQRQTGEQIFDGIARGTIDHYIVRPGEPPDALFHQVISSLLLEWAESRRNWPYTIRIIGETWSGRAYELRSALESCAMPHQFALADSEEGRALVEKVGGGNGRGTKLPIVEFPDGTILVDPTNAELAKASGSPVEPGRINFDLVIVGGGPAGLSAAVYGASEGFSTLVVDTGGIGGQATSSSLIRNYLGFPRGLSGRRLAQQAYEQAWVFGAKFAFMQNVEALERDEDGLHIRLADGQRVGAHAVILATGASYRRLGVEELEELNGAGVYYGAPASEATAMQGREVYIVGGGNSAGQAALYLARFAKRVTLVIRGQTIEAGMSHYLARELEETPKLRVLLRTEVVGGGGAGRLERLVLLDRASGTQETVEADAMFVMIGATPATDWLPDAVARDKRGFVLTGPDMEAAGAWSLDRTPLPLETSMAGVLAAGDVRHGSVKRVASAVGEGSVAIQQVHQLFATERLHPSGRPQEPQPVTRD